jgi:hypothetical protein
METKDYKDFLVVLVNLETRETEAVLCTAETSTEAAIFMTQLHADRGLDAIAVFPRNDILQLCAGGASRIARAPLPVEDYVKLRQWVLNTPTMLEHAKRFGQGGDEEMHDKLPEFIEKYRMQLQAEMSKATKKEA